MTTVLFPRLSVPEALRRMLSYRAMNLDQISATADAILGSLPVTYAALGGNRIPEESLLKLRSQIRALARQSGYPDSADRAGQQRFDRDAAVLLRTAIGASAGEAVRPDTWQFISAGLLPDVVRWRFAPEKPDGPVTDSRFLGGNRNCFGRLWQRAVVLRDERLQDPDTILKSLKEDNFVAILERSAFAAMPAPCCEVARAFLLRRSLARDQSGRSLEEALLRDAMCRVVRSTGHVAFWSLTDDQLVATVNDHFDRSLKAFGLVTRKSTELLAENPALALVAERSDASPASRIGDLTTAVPFRVNRKFVDLDDNDRTNAVWQIVLGRGAEPVDELVRAAAVGLKQRGMLDYERLREDGPMYLSILSAIERGVRSSRFDIPTRGHRRAVAKQIAEVPETIIQELLLQRIYSGVREDLAVSVLTTEITSRLGIKDRRSAEELAANTLAHLRSMGRVVTKGGVIRSELT